MMRVIVAALLLGAAGCWLTKESQPARLDCPEIDCKYDSSGAARECECYE